MWSKLRFWLKRSEEEKELAEELRAHMAIESRERIDAGESPEQAAAAARREMGNPTWIGEEVREAWGWAALERFLSDLRVGLRTLRKTPAWTAVISLTLALGVGLSTAIFSVVYSVLLQPLPYPNAEQLVALWPSAPRGAYQRFNVSAALWMEWKKRSTLLEDIALTRPIANFNLTGAGTPERLQGARTTANLFSVLRMEPMLGRAFTEEERRNDARVAVLSYGFWKRRFGGDPGIVGRKIEMNGGAYEVIGVMPAEFRYPSETFELWTPLYIPPDEFRPGMNYQYISVGRIKAGMSVKQVTAEFASIMHSLSLEFPEYRMDNQWLNAVVEPLAESDAVQVRDALRILFAAVGCLLLIGCMNLAVLLIARANARSRELALRVALGASGSRIRRQLLAEVMPLSFVGIAGGLFLAWAILRALTPFLPANMPRTDTVGLHGPVVAFAVIVSLAVVALAGMCPGWMVGRNQPASSLQQGSRSVTGGGRARNMLVMAQMTVTLILIFGGLLFARSFRALLEVNPGFSSRGVMTIHMAVTRAKYKEDERVADYYRRIVDRVLTIPGVTAAGFVNRLPMSGIAQTGSVEFEGREGVYDSDWRSATPGYFDAMGIPLKQGRLLRDSDTTHSPPVGLIDERLARQAFGAKSPIGKRFRRALPGLPQQDPWSEIVGVTGHIRNDNLERDPRPQVYWPESQHAQDRAALVVRTMGKPETVTSAVIDQIRREDPDQPVYEVRSMDQWVERTLQTRSLVTGLITMFGAASLLLACLGLYGVVSYTAELRLREFGIRVALGAGSWSIGGLVLRQAARLAVLGCAIGLLLLWPVGRALQSQLFGVTGGDWISWFGAPTLLILVALLSGLGPARHAVAADPAQTLRGD